MSSSSPLVDNLVNATDLPEEGLRKELSRLIQKAGLDENEMSLEDLRGIMAEYLQDVLLEAKKEYSESS